MRVARIVMWGCQAFQSLRPQAYVGYRLLSDGRIEHLLIRKGYGLETVKLRMECDECILGKLLKSSTLVSMPIVLDDGRRLRFLVAYNHETKRLIARHRDQLDTIEILDLRRVVLTKKQRQVLRLAANGTGTSPTKIADKLGVSRQAAQKLLQNLVRKISTIMA